ncbi:CD109 antigen-like [Anopheles aquasalis]|uniref:CD109 antigen-like n=1 Tax=Anopheles aquasalis TaxID=42839 RepID=UPI00215A99A8|nr:CD109 antigen-like [Anopheles aquasalis]
MCSMKKFSLCIVLMCISQGKAVLIMGPNTIRPNRDYTLVVSNIFGENKNNCSLNVRLEGIGTNGSSPIILTKYETVLPYTNKMITFKVPSLPLGVHYSVIIEGKQPSTSAIVNIHQKFELNYRRSSVIGFIQFNKPVFRPDETLKFRVVVVDLDLKPRETTVSVFVSEPFGNYFRKWTNISLNQGVFEDQIKIPTMPVMGAYKIEAMAKDEYLTLKTFEVKDYELFSIYLHIYPTVVPLVEHQALDLTVTVKNDLGIPVSGTLQIDLYFDDGKQDSTWKLEVNGIRQVYLHFSEKLVVDYPTHVVLLKVIFTEQYTNRTTVKDQRITVYKYKYKVTHRSRLTYRPGTPFTATLEVTDLNNKPANNVTLLVAIGGAEGLIVQNYTSNMTGYMNIFMHTNESTSIDYLQVFEGDHKKLTKTIYELESASDMFIEVKLLTRVKFNRMVKLMVICSHRMTILLYYVICKGNIVDAGFFRPNRMNRYPFQVLMSSRLMPHSRIIVASIVNNKMILATVDVSVKELGNPLEMKIEENISEDGVDPGDEIELAIRGRPGSFVALTAYDQRLFQQHKNHDIFLVDIWKNFIMFHNIVFVNAAGIISNAGLFVWTFDESITIPERNQYKARGIYPDEPRYGMPEPYRTEFRESWLWQNVTIPPSGRIGLVVKVPHSTTSWCITGFSMHPEYGLASVNKPIRFPSLKIFFILDRLPKFIKRGETVSLYFTLFSALKEVFQANVTMFNAKSQLEFANGPAEGSQIMAVPPNSSTTVSFVVKPMKLGELEIRLNASIMQGVISDSFRKIITVFPEDIWLLGSKHLRYGNGTYSNKSFDIPLLIERNVKKGCLQIDLIVEPEPMYSFRESNDLNVSLTYGDMEQMIHLNLFEDDDITKNITMNSVLDNNRHFYVTVTGFGKGIIQLNWQVKSCNSFILEMTKQPTANKLLKQLQICCSYIPEIVNQHSNDTLVEVSIPIGYAMDSHSVLKNASTNPINKIELLHDGTTLKVYYNRMGVETTCFSVFAYKRFGMPVKRPSYIRVQDSRRPELNAMKLFEFHKDLD